MVILLMYWLSLLCLLISGAVIPCRVVGMLKMTDESGVDAKFLAVPTN